MSGVEAIQKLAELAPYVAVLKLLADGLAVKQIAEELSVSYFTVNFHVKNLYKNLEASSQSGAIAKAFRAGLLE